MWDNVSLLLNKKQTNSYIGKTEIDNKQIMQPSSVSNCLNNYFCNIPPTLASQLSNSDRKATSYLSYTEVNHFQFPEISEMEIPLNLENLDSKKSSGIDKVYSILLR